MNSNIRNKFQLLLIETDERYIEEKRRELKTKIEESITEIKEKTYKRQKNAWYNQEGENQKRLEKY